jgi:hypothetical protein
VALFHQNTGTFHGADVITHHTFDQKSWIGCVICFVISDDLIAAIIVHHNTTIPKIFNINIPKAHKAHHH